MLFDTHAHYNDEQFSEDIDGLLSSMNENNVGLIMIPASKLSEMDEIIALCEKYPFVYGAAGIHPGDLSEAGDDTTELIRKAAQHSKIKAVGEIGLDYYYGKETEEVQMPEDKSPVGSYLLIGLAAAGALGAGYYFKVYKSHCTLPRFFRRIKICIQARITIDTRITKCASVLLFCTAVFNRPLNFS